MKLADRSPGITIALAAAVVYGQILIEIGMWMISAYAAVAFAMVTAIVLTFFILRFFSGLLSEEEPGEVAVAAAAPERAPAPAKRRQQRFARPAHV